jgi:hypothetical protein
MVDLINLNGMDFSTLDRDNDRAPLFSCGKRVWRGWWYAWCAHSFLIGSSGILWSPKVLDLSKVKAMIIKAH